VCLQRAIDDIDAMAATLCLAKDKHFAAREAARAASSGGVAGVEPPRMPRWTPAEIERLYTVYADRDNLAVARLLGRSVTSVANKANQLGLKKTLGVLATIGRTNVEIRYRTAGGAEASAP
jgi:hypothetical protein